MLPHLTCPTLLAASLSAATLLIQSPLALTASHTNRYNWCSYVTLCQLAKTSGKFSNQLLALAVHNYLQTTLDLIKILYQ